MIKDYRNLRTSVASLAPLVLLAALLFVQAPAWGQSEEPTRPAQCANATTTQDDWIDSVTATSSTITVTLADPIPRAGKIAISACRSGTSAWVLSDITPAAGDQFTIDYVANNNSGPDTLKIQPDTDYWVRVQAWNYSGNNSVYHHIRTTAETTFVSNTGVTSDGTERAGFATAGDTTHSRLAQTFTTGSATNGYALAKVDVALGANSGDRDEKNTLRVRIFSVSSSGDPDSALHTLTQPSSLSDSAVNTYSALGNATLDANTDYAVVLDGTSTDHSIEIARVTSDDEDSGAAAGWGIADGQRTSTDLSSWTLLSHSLQIAVKGSEIPSSSGSTTPNHHHRPRHLAGDGGHGGRVHGDGERGAERGPRREPERVRIVGRRLRGGRQRGFEDGDDHRHQHLRHLLGGDGGRHDQRAERHGDGGGGVGHGLHRGGPRVRPT